MSSTDTTAPAGAGFERQAATIRDWVTADGSSGFAAEPGRYHLYVSLACPWAHRTMIVRRLKGLEDVISLSVVDPIRDERSWAFRDVPGAEPDPVNGFSFLREAYEATVPGWDAHVSVPVLWDRERGRIVNQESADIVVMLNEAFNDRATPGVELYPEALRAEIDDLNGWVYDTVNNGVYKAGFSSDQQAHEEAVKALFVSLDRLEERLTDQRYLFGNQTTLADWRLFTTLLRFDPVYNGHFKCNVRRIVDYPSLWGYLRDLLSVPGIRDTVNMDHIKRHYYMTHPQINPMRIVPVGPALDYDQPHGREALTTA